MGRHDERQTERGDRGGWIKQRGPHICVVRLFGPLVAKLMRPGPINGGCESAFAGVYCCLEVNGMCWYFFSRLMAFDWSYFFLRLTVCAPTCFGANGMCSYHAYLFRGRGRLQLSSSAMPPLDWVFHECQTKMFAGKISILLEILLGFCLARLSYLRHETTNDAEKTDVLEKSSAQHLFEALRTQWRPFWLDFQDEWTCLAPFTIQITKVKLHTITFFCIWELTSRRLHGLDKRVNSTNCTVRHV